jgi:hypothetical protein
MRRLIVGLALFGVVALGGPGASPGVAAAQPSPTPGATERVELVVGCNNVTMTWPSGTPTAMVIASVMPPSAVVALWRYEARDQRFIGFSPQFPGASDFTTLTRLDAAFICVNAPAVMLRPAV